VSRIRPLFLLALLLPLNGCFGYRLIRPDEVRTPSYEPRPVAVPAECEPLVARAAAPGGAAGLTEAEARTVEFCQHQQLLRAQEEEAASRKLEAHAQAASFALQVTGVVVGATVAILAWLF
jgi:hypothetical protein